MKKITVAIIAIAVLALGAIFVSAQKHDGEGHGKRGFGKRGHHRGGGMMLRGLDLTDAQKAQVKEIMEASKTKTQSLRESMKASRKALHELTANGQFDEAKVQAAATEQANISAQLMVERAKVQAQIYQILTPEQHAKAAEMKAKMKERFKGKKGGFKRGDRSKAVEAPAQ